MTSRPAVAVTVPGVTAVVTWIGVGLGGLSNVDRAVDGPVGVSAGRGQPEAVIPIGWRLAV